jgi:hypothetical protein
MASGVRDDKITRVLDRREHSGVAYCPFSKKTLIKRIVTDQPKTLQPFSVRTSQTSCAITAMEPLWLNKKSVTLTGALGIAASFVPTGNGHAGVRGVKMRARAVGF